MNNGGVRMKRRKLSFIVILLFIYLAISGCSSADLETVIESEENKAIRLVRDHVEEGQIRSIGDYLKSYVVPKGTVIWEAFLPKGEISPDIYCVEAQLSKEINGKENTAIFQYLVNIKAEKFETAYFEINGEPKPINLKSVNELEEVFLYNDVEEDIEEEDLSEGSDSQIETIQIDVFDTAIKGTVNIMIDSIKFKSYITLLEITIENNRKEDISIFGAQSLSLVDPNTRKSYSAPPLDNMTIQQNIPAGTIANKSIIFEPIEPGVEILEFRGQIFSMTPMLDDNKQFNIRFEIK